MVFFSVIAITYRYGSAVSLDNTYIHLHAVTRLVGTNCPRKWRFDLNESTAKFDNRTIAPQYTVPISHSHGTHSVHIRIAASVSLPFFLVH